MSTVLYLESQTLQCRICLHSILVALLHYVTG